MILRRYTTINCIRVWRDYTVVRYVAPLAAVAVIGCAGYVAGRGLPAAPPPIDRPYEPGLLLLPETQAGPPLAATPFAGPHLPDMPVPTAAGYAIGLRGPAIPVPAPAGVALLPVFALALLLLRITRRRADDTDLPRGIAVGLGLVAPFWVGLWWLV